MTEFHPLIQRQLRGLLAPGEELSRQLAGLLARVDETYREFDSDRALLERSLEISSQELLQANSEMRVVIHAFPDLFLRLDGDGTICSCRASNGDDLLYPPVRMIGHRIQDLPGKPARQAFQAALDRIRAGETAATINYSLTIHESERHYEARLLALHTGQVLAIIRNITERMQAEGELVAAREAALEVARIKSEFLANVSHELRTPLTCIIGMTELLIDSEPLAEQREFLAAVKLSADALLGLLNDILDFSIVETGKFELDAFPFSIRDCVGAAVKSLAPRAHQKSLALTCDIDPEVSERLVGDPGRLRQVMVNLVGNAIKFTDRGEVVVQVERVEVSAARATLRFRVRDTGIGIPRDQCARIFDAFSQVDGSMTRRHGGTGLGLAVSAQVVGLMGGTIEVQSDPGMGSTFTFTASFDLEPADILSATPAAPELLRDPPVLIAAADAQMSVLAGRRSLRQQGRSLHVLVAEDNEWNRQIIVRLLEKRGHQVVAVGNGRLALEAVRQARFDVVLMDVQMPEVDGLEASMSIRQEEFRSGHHVPIIALTAHALAGDRERCLEAGMDAYVTKPVDGEKLFATIEALTRTARAEISAAMVPTVEGEHESGRGTS